MLQLFGIYWPNNKYYKVVVIVNVVTREWCCLLLFSRVVSNGAGQVSDAVDERDAAVRSTGGDARSEVTRSPHVSFKPGREWCITLTDYSNIR